MPHSLVATYHICWPIVVCVCAYIHLVGLRVRIRHSCVEGRNVAHWKCSISVDGVGMRIRLCTEEQWPL